VPHDPQHIARKMFSEIDLGDQTLSMPRTPISHEIATGPAPTQGRDTRNVLMDAGFSEPEIDALIAASIAR
jgi:crotonobetainyl-CoA:carnitine CoA-transferase CaiB-like acyl-CoA transferase